MYATLLILGGTREAIAYAEALSQHIDPTRIIYSLAGVTEHPQWPMQTQRRVGGFGGTDSMAAYLRDQQVKLCLDATHPFARQISAQAQQACAQQGVTYIPLIRQPWTQHPNDCWRVFNTAEDIITALDAEHDCVLFTLGRRNLSVFSKLIRTRGVFRMITPPEDQHGLLSTNRHQILCLRPPYTFDTETRIIDEYGVSCLVTRDSGGKRPPKLDAYAERQLPVWIIDDQCVGSQRVDSISQDALSPIQISQQFQQY